MGLRRRGFAQALTVAGVALIMLSAFATVFLVHPNSSALAQTGASAQGSCKAALPVSSGGSGVSVSRNCRRSTTSTGSTTSSTDSTSLTSTSDSTALTTSASSTTTTGTASSTTTSQTPVALTSSTTSTTSSATTTTTQPVTTTTTAATSTATQTTTSTTAATTTTTSSTVTQPPPTTTTTSSSTTTTATTTTAATSTTSVSSSATTTTTTAPLTTTTASTTTTSTASPKLLWSWNFENGAQWSNNGPTSNLACGNNPGVVVSTLAHTGTYSGYYAVNDPSAPDPCASFPSHDTVDQNTNPWTSTITTEDYSTTVWVYVPSQTLTGWTSYVTIEMGNGTNWNYAEGIAIDATANRQLYIYNNGLFVNAQGANHWGYYTWENTLYYPLNQWFSITVEMHQRPSTQSSWMVLYQNGVEVQRLIDTEPNPTPWLPWTFHWGMYAGSGQQTNFQVYNDDIAIYDLTGTASSLSPTSPGATFATQGTILPYGAVVAVTSLASFGIERRQAGRRSAKLKQPRAE